MTSQTNRIAVACTALLVAACAGNARRPYHPPNLASVARILDYSHNGQLLRGKNGLQIMLLPDENTNLVKVDVRYQVGSAEDPVGKTGLAHLVEHMMFAFRPEGPGTPTLGNLFEAQALYHNAFTNSDETHYTATAMRDQLAGLLNLEAKRLSVSCEQFDEETFVRERDVVVNENRERSAGASGFVELLYRTAYGEKHPYARSVGGSEADVSGLALADVCSFVEKYYAPERVILVVSGDIDATVAVELINASFAPIAARSVAPRVVIEAPVFTGATTSQRLPVREAGAFLIFPAVAFADESRAVSRLVTSLLEARLGILRDKAGINDVGVITVGGVRNPVTVVWLGVDKEDQLERAVDLFFSKRDELLEILSRDKLDSNGVELQALREEQQQKLLSSVEPLGSRGSVFADYLQYADHKWFVIADLRAFAAATRVQVGRETKSAFRRESSHVLYIRPLPEQAKGEAGQKAEVHNTSKDYDLADWKVPVDVSEAEKTLPVLEKKGRVSVREWTLDNGLRVLLAPDLSYPLIDIRLMFPAGALHEPMEKKGIATLASQFLSYDWDSPGPQTYTRLMDLRRVMAMGGQVRAYGDERTTTFRMTGLSVYADGLLWKLHWLLESGHYPSKTLQTARKRASSTETEEDRKDAARRHKFRSILYGAEHPYASELSAHNLDTVTTGDLEEFRKAHYRINGATLIVTGRFPEAQVRGEIERLFGGWDGALACPAPPLLPDIPARKSTQYLAAEDTDAEQISLSITFPTLDGFKQDRAARKVLQNILEQRMSSLRARLGSTYGLHVSHVSRQGPGLYRIYGEIDADRAGETLAAIDDEVERLRKGEGLEEDFVRARRFVLRSVLADAVSSESVADELELIATYGLSRNYYQNQAADVASLSIDNVRELIRKRLDRKDAVYFASGKKSKVQAMYKAIGIDSYDSL